MSFSFSASGTKDQVLRQLGELVHQHDSHSKQAADLVTSVAEGGPAEIPGADGQIFDAVYSISCYGHSSAGHDLPSLSISFSASPKLREKPADAQGDVITGEARSAGD